MLQLFFTIIVVAVVTIFAGFNLNNKCDVNLIFYKFENIPVFATIILSFMGGIIAAMPYVFVKRHKRQQKAKIKEPQQPKEEKTEKPPKQSFWSKVTGSNSPVANSSETSEQPKDEAPSDAGAENGTAAENQDCAEK